jgi:hypothetical protein
MAINKEKRFLGSVLWIIVHRHYIVSPSPRFSLFMAIILSVLRLVFPYLWPLYCLSFISFFLIDNIMAINKEKRGEGQTI